MKVRNVVTILAGVLLSCFVSAKADTINVTVGSTGSLLNGSGVANESQYQSLSGANNNNPGSNLNFLTGVLHNWTGAGKTPAMEVPTMTGATEASGFSGSAGGTFGFTGVTGTAFNYVVLHYGNGPAGGSPGGWWQAYFIGGMDVSTLTFTVPTVNGEKVGGVSSARFFDGNGTIFATVPDGGMTLILLGAALSGLAITRRFVKA